MNGERMTGQLSLFDQTDAKFDPLRETAIRVRPCWTTSAKTLVDLCNEDPDIERWTEAVKNEYCPNGLAGHLGADNGPGTLIGWELRTKNVMIKYFDKYGTTQTMVATWQDFAREIADLIWSGEFQEGKGWTKRNDSEL